jgi:hypothetical protein
MAAFSRTFLMRIMARGAAVLCADNQLGIDAIIPFCYKGKILSPKNISALLVQGKNVFTLSSAQSPLLANMDPKYVGVVEKEFKGNLPSS